MRKRCLCALMLAILAAATTAMAQGRRFGGDFFGGSRYRNFTPYPNVPYDGRFAFVRVIYESDASGYWYRGLPSWAHGYPMAEQNLMKIMNEVSFLTAHEDITTLRSTIRKSSSIRSSTSSRSAGGRSPTPRRAALRAYMQKGGFVIVDDFKAYLDFGSRGWDPFEDEHETRPADGALLRHVGVASDLPFVFRDQHPRHLPQAYNAGRPVFRGIYEDNDPAKRLMMIVNYNTDVSQYWEWSGTGLRPIDDTNEAYKLGVNYVVYGLTH